MTRKIISAILALILCVSLAVCVSASDPNWEEIFLIDDANLLTDSEEAALTRKLEAASNAYNAQMVIVTITDADGWDVATFTDLLYDTAGFGYGSQKDGILLLICMDPREYQILTNGYAGVVIGPAEIDRLCDVMDDHLPYGEYVEAFVGFTEGCAAYLDQGSYDYSDYAFPVGRWLAISLVIGLVVGLIVVLIMKGKLKSVRRQYRAHDYVRDGSMKVDIHHDIFLYRTVTRRKNSDSSSSDSHSRSSGGSARSRGGGSF